MDTQKLLYILDQWAHQKYDFLGPQSVSAIKKAEQYKEKISNKTINTNELFEIMRMQKQLQCS